MNSKAEFQTALKEHKIVVLDAFATWCGPCKVIAPQVVKYVFSPHSSTSIIHRANGGGNRFSEEFTGAHFIKLDVDEVPDVAQELGIRAMPTFLIFKNEDKVQEIVGANPKALLAAIESAVKAEE
jgi:thioredoxin 1